MGTIVSIHVAGKGGAPLGTVSEARLVAERGIAGDRYHEARGTFSDRPGPDRELTLIEIEEIERLNATAGLALAPGELRRNIVTRGVALNDLVGVEFQVGTARVRGIRLCEPCRHLAGLTSPAVLRGMVHRAGLRATIVESGVARAGDPVGPA